MLMTAVQLVLVMQVGLQDAVVLVAVVFVRDDRFVDLFLAQLMASVVVVQHVLRQARLAVVVAVLRLLLLMIVLVMWSAGQRRRRRLMATV